MATATMRTNEELEALQLKSPEFTGYVQEFEQRMTSRCLRCGGFMARDCNWHAACRCVQCGDVIDPVILRNRQLASANFVEEPRRRSPPMILRQHSDMARRNSN